MDPKKLLYYFVQEGVLQMKKNKFLIVLLTCTSLCFTILIALLYNFVQILTEI